MAMMTCSQLLPQFKDHPRAWSALLRADIALAIQAKMLHGHLICGRQQLWTAQDEVSHLTSVKIFIQSGVESYKYYSLPLQKAGHIDQNVSVTARQLYSINETATKSSDVLPPGAALFHSLVLQRLVLYWQFSYAFSQSAVT